MSTTLPARGRGRGRGRGAGREAAEPFSFGSARAETASDESDGKAIDAKDATAAHASSSSATAPPTSTPMNTNGSGASRGGSTSSLLSNTLRAYHGLNDNGKSDLGHQTLRLEFSTLRPGLSCTLGTPLFYRISHEYRDFAHVCWWKESCTSSQAWASLVGFVEWSSAIE